jgi:hypothetical protein
MLVWVSPERQAELGGTTAVSSHILGHDGACPSRFRLVARPGVHTVEYEGESSRDAEGRRA